MRAMMRVGVVACVVLVSTILVGDARAFDEKPKGGPAGKWKVVGEVEDEEDRPIAGAILTWIDYERPDPPHEIIANADGKFEIEFSREVRAVKVRARDKAGEQWGFANFYQVQPQKKPKTIFLHPTREVTVRVVDRAGKPVEGATVDVTQSDYSVNRQKTGAEGTVKARVATETGMLVRGMKAKTGFDYFTYWPARKNQPKIPTPESVPLKLEGAQTVKVRAVDHQDKPIAGVAFELSMLRRAPRDDYAMVSLDDLMTRTTDADGRAVFEWIPLDQANPMSLDCRTPEFVTDLAQYVDVSRRQDEYLIRLWRKTALSGEVKMPDGTLAADAKIRVQGKGPVSMTEEYQTTTGSDGRYQLEVRTEQVYVVVAEKGDLVGHQTGVVTHEGQATTKVTVHLKPGTVVRGKLTQGKNESPVAKKEIEILLEGGPLPIELKYPPSQKVPFNVPAYFRRMIETDASGSYRFLVSAGDYLLNNPITYESTKVVVHGEKEIVQDFHIGWEDSTITGTVIDPEGKPVAGAKIEGEYVHIGKTNFPTFRLTADREGQFQSARKTIPIRFRILSPDQKLGIIARVEEGTVEQKFTLQPLCSVRGTLVDAQGNPKANAVVRYYVNLFEGEKQDRGIYSKWNGETRTNDAGEYHIPRLTCGAEWILNYAVTPKHDREIGKIFLVEPGTFDMKEQVVQE